jgi:hypothetical protein
MVTSPAAWFPCSEAALPKGSDTCEQGSARGHEGVARFGGHYATLVSDGKLNEEERTAPTTSERAAEVQTMASASKWRHRRST